MNDKQHKPDRLIIAIDSCLNSDGIPSVQIRWPEGQLGAQLSPEEARQHALDVLTVAESAEYDAIFFAWLKSTGTWEMSFIVALLHEFRQFRSPTPPHPEGS